MRPQLLESVDRGDEVEEVALLADRVVVEQLRGAEAGHRGDPEASGGVEERELPPDDRGGDLTLDQADPARRIDPVVLDVGRQEAAQHLVGRPADGRHGRDAEALVDERATRVVDAGDHVLDAVVLAGDAGAEDVGVVAVGDCSEGAGLLDPRFGQGVAVEPEAYHGSAREPCGETAKRAGLLVDHRDGVTAELEEPGQLAADPAAPDNYYVHLAASYPDSGGPGACYRPWVTAPRVGRPKAATAHGCSGELAPRVRGTCPEQWHAEPGPAIDAAGQRVFEVLKRIFVGRPLATADQEHQRLTKTIALAVFSSDAISSTAYASEEILFVTALGASSLHEGLDVLVPISIAVAVLLAIVVTSYRQTIIAYPSGGGSYVVSRENLGENPSLIAGASLLVDYILTVAVSISAGVAAIISIPTFRDLADHRVALCLVLIVLITLVNLRGVKESGRIFSVPTYLYIGILMLLVGYGLYRVYFGDVSEVPFDAEAFEGTREIGGNLSLFLILKGFSSGAVALTGVEAITNGVPPYRRPQSKHAAISARPQQQRAAAALLGKGTAKEASIAVRNTGRVPFGIGAFMGALQYRQFPPWVGNSWDITAGEGPYVIAEAVAAAMPEIVEEFEWAIGHAIRQAGLEVETYGMSYKGTDW